MEEESPIFDPTATLAVLPHLPGCYLMKDRQGRVVYVGKASDLRNRVRSYFQREGDGRPFVRSLPRLLSEIDIIVCDNEKEAVILEATLIREHRPKFNVRLQDDKRFLCLRIDPHVAWPRVEVVRRPQQDDAVYFGPYHSATSIRRTLHLLNRHFQLRTCDDTYFANRKRPCLQHQIERCPAPCVFDIDRSQYQENVHQAILFLQGRNDELMGSLRQKMLRASEELAFERAARYRDQIHAIQTTMTRQRVVSFESVDRDVFATFRVGERMIVQVQQVRSGRLLSSRSFSFSGLALEEAELLGSFLGQYYLGQAAVPREVLLPFAIPSDEKQALESYLSSRRGQKVGLIVPMRGPKKSLVLNAQTNAEQSFRKRFSKRDLDEPLELLSGRLNLRRIPRRMECYDISQLQGQQAVGSMVVCIDGKMDPSEYRRFHIKSVQQQDDFASLREVLSRRFRQLQDDPSANRPDLIVIDGGKGQLSQVIGVANDQGLDGIDIVSLAKSRVKKTGFQSTDVARSRERVFVPDSPTAIVLDEGPALYLLQRLRDEAHRFAITFHKQMRRKHAKTSILDGIPGVGPKTKRNLLRHFGGIAPLTAATIEELLEVEGVGRKTAEVIQSHLQSTTPLE